MGSWRCRHRFTGKSKEHNTALVFSRRTVKRREMSHSCKRLTWQTKPTQWHDIALRVKRSNSYFCFKPSKPIKNDEGLYCFLLVSLLALWLQPAQYKVVGTKTHPSPLCSEVGGGARSCATVAKWCNGEQKSWGDTKVGMKRRRDEQKKGK